MGRIVGIDFGKRRIGIAITDPDQTLAMPFKTAKATDDLNFSVSSVLDALKDHLKEIEHVVIGLPLLLTGEEGDMALLVKKFADLLQEKTNIPFTLWDERLSSAHATALLKEVNLSRKKRSRILDEATASLLLQNYLDCQQFSIPPIRE